MSVGPTLDERAAAIEARLDVVGTKGATLSDTAAVLRDAKAMIGELRVTFVATDLLARKNIAAIGDEELLARLMPLVKRKLQEKE